MACVFRDHVLSDLIGFTYASWPAETAARRFRRAAREAGRRYASRTGGEEALIPIILDGENAWEHFEGGGRPFLRALYGLLSEHPDLRTVTMAESVRGRRAAELTGIFPARGSTRTSTSGSATLTTSGRGASWLMHARRSSLRREVDAARLSRAREEILIAEGSDWFWWYGDDHSSAHDSEFDALFRRHLRNAYELLGQPIPRNCWSATSRPPRGRRLRPASSPQPWTARKPAISSGWAPAPLSLVPIRGPCIEARRRVAPSRGSMWDSIGSASTSGRTATAP